MRRVLGWWLLGALAGPVAAQELAPGLAQVVDDRGERVRDARVVLLPADRPEAQALAAIVGTDLVHAAVAGTTVVAVGEAVGRLGFVALDLDPAASTHAAPEGVADLLRVPPGAWWAVAGAPGCVPDAAARWTSGPAPAPLTLRVRRARTVLCTFDLTLRVAAGLAAPARVTLRALPMRPERPRRVCYRDGNRQLDCAHPGRGAAAPPVVEQAAAHGAVVARCADSDCRLLLPVPAGRPLACAISPDVELRVWAGPGLRAGRCGLLRLDDPPARALLLRAPRAGSGRLRVRVVGPDDRPVDRAEVYLFPEGGPGFERQGLGPALEDPVRCCAALRALREHPPEQDLTIAGGRAMAAGGEARFEGLAADAMRCVVVADGLAQATSPEFDVTEDAERTVTVRLVDLRRHVGVVRVAVHDPLTGPFQGRVAWSLHGPQFSDRGTAWCREDGLTLYAPPGPDYAVQVSSDERGGLAGEARGLTAALATATQARVRLLPPDERGGR
jgi:hypothetical protein